MRIERKPKMLILMISLVFILGVSSCNGPRPVEHIYIVDTQHNICSKRKVLSFDPFKTEHIEDLPIIECDGAMSIHRNDVKPFIRWIQDLLRQAQQILQRIGIISETQGKE